MIMVVFLMSMGNWSVSQPRSGEPSSLLPMTGTNYKNIWNWKHLSPSPAVRVAHRSLHLYIAQTTTSSPTVFIDFAPLHPSISTLHTHLLSNIPFQCFTCYIVFTSPPWPFFCLYLPYLTSFAHIVYRLIFLLYVCFTPCVTLLLNVSNCFALSWPGRSCKWELVLN